MILFGNISLLRNRLSCWIVSLCIYAVLSLVSCTDTDEECFAFIGDSLVANWDTEYYFPMFCTENDGKDGATITDISNSSFFKENKTVILLVGTNDLGVIGENMDEKVDSLVQRYISMVGSIIANRIIAISILPRSDMDNATIKRINGLLQKELNKFSSIYFLDVFDDFMENDTLNPEYTSDKLHLNEKGYELLSQELKKVIGK